MKEHAEPHILVQPCARLIKVERGLHVLTIGSTRGPSGTSGGTVFPAIQIASPPSNQFDPVEIMTSWADAGAWLGQSGGVVVLRSPPGGGYVLVTAYVEEGAPAAFPDAIELRPLEPADRQIPRSETASSPAPREAPAILEQIVDIGVAQDEPPVADPPLADPHEVDTQIMLHIARQGDRVFPGRGWVGNVGRRLQIEAFSITPRSKLSPGDPEYKAFGPGGRETRWTSEAKVCGTRGRGLPLTGFAIRLRPPVRDQFDVLYQGAFFDSGVTELCRNGEPCLPAQQDDILQAINLRIVERGGR